MSATEKYLTLRLFGLNGHRVGAARVPANPLPPVVVIWGNRHFMLTAPKADYQEIVAHLIPLEHMYAGDALPPAAPSEPVR